MEAISRGVDRLARPLTDLGHVGSIVFGILLALVAIWSLWRARVGSCRPLRRSWWSGLSCRWRTPRSHRRADSGMVGGSAPAAADPDALGAAPLVQSRWFTMLRTLPSGARTKNRRTPHGSVVSGCTIS